MDDNNPSLPIISHQQNAFENDPWEEPLFVDPEAKPILEG